MTLTAARAAASDNRASSDAPINSLTDSGSLSHGLDLAVEDTSYRLGPLKPGTYSVFVGGMPADVVVCVRTVATADDPPSVDTPDDNGKAVAAFTAALPERLFIGKDKPYLEAKAIGGTGLLFVVPLAP